MSSKTTLDLTGKVALITGASRGIGRETAIRFGLAGARVAVNYLRRGDEAADVVAAIGEDRAIAIQADVSRPDEVKRMVEQTIEALDGLHILVNNAAVYGDNRFDGTDYEAWQRGWLRTFEVNLFGAANAAFLAMRWMREHGGGKIINVSSRAAWRGRTEFADYGASKAAMVNLTRSIARGCAGDNIISSCVTPGFIDTDMAHPALDVEGDLIRAQVPLGRVGTVDDVAAAILFLASPMADYLNGTCIDINGGSWFH